MEIWKQIKGYEKLYEISNYGNIRSLKRNNTNGRQLSKNFGARGYYQVTLSKNNVRKTARIHRLVAETFIPNVEKKEIVNHIDGNKLNNNVDNLEWCTEKENVNHAWKNNLCSVSEKHREVARETCRKNGKLNTKKVNQYDKNKKYIKQWESIIEASKYCKIDRGNITKCCKKERKTAGGYYWALA